MEKTSRWVRCWMARLRFLASVVERFLSLCAQSVSRLARFREQTLALRVRILRGLLQQRRPLLIEILALALELILFLGGCGFLRRGVRELGGDPLLPRVDGVKDGLVEVALHQPHQDDEVERLCADGVPVDQHGLLTGGLRDDVTPERVGENEDHRDHEAVDGQRLDHRQAHEQGPGDRLGSIRLLGQRAQRRGDGLPFANAGPRLPRAMVMPATKMDATAMIVVLSMVFPLVIRVLFKGWARAWACERASRRRCRRRPGC